MKSYKPMEYLQIDLCNHWGGGDMSFEERIKWVDNQTFNELENLTVTAKDKFRYTASLMAYNAAMNGIPTGYLIGLDANASGIAILGALTGCETTARNTGIIGKKQSDVYKVCTDVMARDLDAEIDVTRKEVKDALMPNYYGSQARPKELFGEGTEEHAAFMLAAETIAPGAHLLKNICLMSWQPFTLAHTGIMPDGFYMRLPVLQTMVTKLEIDELDHASIKMLYEDNVGTESGLSLVANFTHGCDSLMVREVGRRCKYNECQLHAAAALCLKNITSSNDFDVIPGRTQMPGIEKLWYHHKFLSLVGIEHINEDNYLHFGNGYCRALLCLIGDTLDKPSFDVLFIHDEYLSHANYMDYVRQTVIDVLAEMADSEIASYMLTQFTNSPVTVPKFTRTLGDQIRESEYIIS